MTAYEMRISDWSSDVSSSDLTVLIWFDPEHGEPDYEIPPLADFFPAGATDSQGWTKGWRRFRITIKTHPREVIEHTVDKGHLLPIHGYDVDQWLPVWNGHMTGQLIWGPTTRSEGRRVGQGCVSPGRT